MRDSQKLLFGSPATNLSEDCASFQGVGGFQNNAELLLESPPERKKTLRVLLQKTPSPALQYPLVESQIHIFSFDFFQLVSSFISLMLSAYINGTLIKYKNIHELH